MKSLTILSTILLNENYFNNKIKIFRLAFYKYLLIKQKEWNKKKNVASRWRTGTYECRFCEQVCTRKEENGINHI